jgi:hypothetical protein
MSSSREREVDFWPTLSLHGHEMKIDGYTGAFMVGLAELCDVGGEGLSVMGCLFA